MNTFDSQVTVMKISKKWPLVVSLLLLCPFMAQAHPGVPGHVHGFAEGLAHPLTGLDHICAMIAVGLWAAQRGGRFLWLVPLTFVSVMTVGGLIGMSGFQIPFVEQGIAASVLVLGILIAAALRLPLSASAALVGVFALFHGLAHGAETPVSVSGLSFAAGFVLATAVLHLAGIGIGLLPRKLGGTQIVRYVGGAIAVYGLVLCFA